MVTGNVSTQASRPHYRLGGTQRVGVDHGRDGVRGVVKSVRCSKPKTRIRHTMRMPIAGADDSSIWASMR
jgi:hypothetical protein